jgi:Ca-activated chloride channel homolog
MKVPMKNWSIFVAAAALFLSASAGAQTPKELPSAPSSVQQQNSAPPTAPNPEPQRSAQPSDSAVPGKTAPSTQSGASFPAVSVPPKNDGTAGQQPQSPNDAEDNNAVETIRKQVNEVNLIFTVTDKRGRFVKDLKKDDIKILDDNKAPLSINSFTSQTDLPLRVGLLIDASNSIRDRFKFEQEAAIEFLNQIVRPKSDLAFVLGFDSTFEVTQDYTDSTEKLSKGVRILRPGGGTALFDAIYFAARDKLMNVAATGPTRRAIIVLSDGEDNQSRVTREEAIEMAQRAEVIIYAISTNISGTKMRGDKVLERFAESTGGRVFFPFKLQDVADAFSDIQDELRSQYALSYRPADFVADGRFRSIDIEAATHKNLRVRARKGYYAPKP